MRRSLIIYLSFHTFQLIVDTRYRLRRAALDHEISREISRLFRALIDAKAPAVEALGKHMHDIATKQRHLIVFGLVVVEQRFNDLKQFNKNRDDAFDGV